MKKFLVLVADDEQSITDIIAFNLQKDNLDVICAYDGEQALDLFKSSRPDLILLDIMMPKMNGFDVCKKIREFSQVPIIMLTACAEESDKVLGLELGADDYVTKPFSNRELVARVKANLRRQAAVKAPAEEDNNTDIQVGDLVIHPEAYTVSKRGENINLTHREFELLHYLAEHIGQVINREHLLQTVWGYDYFGDVRTVDVTVRRLREKIEDNPSHPQWLITRRGVGYYLANPDQN